MSIKTSLKAQISFDQIPYVLPVKLTECQSRNLSRQSWKVSAYRIETLKRVFYRDAGWDNFNGQGNVYYFSKVEEDDGPFRLRLYCGMLCPLPYGDISVPEVPGYAGQDCQWTILYNWTCN
jgi:hypothetical protein